MPTTLKKGRRSTALLAVAAMLTSLVAFAAPAVALDTAACPSAEIPSAGFTDLAGVPADAVDAIDCIAFYGISTGTSATTFSPFTDVERWQMALFLVRSASSMGVSLTSGATGPFTDLAGVPAAAVTAINQIYDLGIATGTSATTFDPFGDVERWQMALFLTRLLDEAGVSLPDGSSQGFTDLAGVPAAAVTAINQLKQLGVSMGTSATTFDPFGMVERWAMALFLARSLDEAGVLPPATKFDSDAPQLLRAERVTSTVVRFVFDEEIPGQALVAPYTGITVYDSAGAAFNPTAASISGNTILAEFTAVQVSSAALGTVRYDTVEDAAGIPNIEGHAPLAPAAVATPAFPGQLLDVKNIRVVTIGGGGQEVRVDFMFADGTAVDPFGATDAQNRNDAGPATAPAPGEAEEFFLVGSNGTEYAGIDIVESTVNTDGSVTVTVSVDPAAATVPESQIRRGYVLVADGAAVDQIVLAEAYESNANSTEQADLVSVERVSATKFRYTFDEAVSNLPADLDPAQFNVAAGNGTVYTATAVQRIEGFGATVVEATFGAGIPTAGTGTPVIAYVELGAVVDTTGGAVGPNHPDEVVLTVPSPTELPAGVTGLPDLQSVTRSQNIVTGNYTVAFTFDSAVDGVLADILFDLYDENGVQFQAQNGGGCVVVLSNSNMTASLTTDCFTNEEMAAARTGAVQDLDATVLPGDRDITEGEVNVTTAS